MQSDRRPPLPPPEIFDGTTTTFSVTGVAASSVIAASRLLSRALDFTTLSKKLLSLVNLLSVAQVSSGQQQQQRQMIVDKLSRQHVN